MKRVIGRITIYIGVFAILASAGWMLYNHWEDNRAGANSELILRGLSDQIRRPVSALGTEPSPDTPSVTEPENEEKQESAPQTIEFDGELYIGILTIPALSLELPVNKELREAALKNSPCRYTGSFSNALVISAHNYRNHFGGLSSLSRGDTAFITDVNGDVHQYTVERTEILHESEVEAMVNNLYDLTLFTCTRSRTERVTVRFSKTRINGDVFIETQPGAPRAPRLRINYRNETLRIRRGYLYSADGGTSFTEVTERRGITLDVSQNIANGTPIYIIKAAEGRRPASHPQIIRP
jgi:sortase A